MDLPQIRFALSRGSRLRFATARYVAVSGRILGFVTQGGALADSRLPWAIFCHPSGVLIQRLRRMIFWKAISVTLH